MGTHRRKLPAVALHRHTQPETKDKIAHIARIGRIVMTAWYCLGDAGEV
jgi:hypothetical protein